MYDSSSAHFTIEGRPFRIESFFTEPTHAGMLCGHPTRQETLERNKKRVTDIFGRDRPMLVIEPPEGERTPHFMCVAWVDSLVLGDKDSDGSHLFLIFYSNTVVFTDPKSLVAAALQGVDWETHAKDWGY